MLNVRSTPEIKEGNVIATLENGSGVKVEEPKKDHSGFYKIIIVDKEDKPKKGYAMKKFIKII
ncbi:MAG: SH3 domain-containing protein [Lachnospiraceae bacterium]|nr:SH3 domain-containing protein [Lachnospiraceae bacterium]